MNTIKGFIINILFLILGITVIGESSAYDATSIENDCVKQSYVSFN